MKSKITTDIITTTGFTVDIPPAKIVINSQEITDLETFNKVVDSIREKDKEIDRLNNIIDELEKYLEERKTHYCIGCSNIYEDSLGRTRLVNEDIFNEITKIKDKLKELKEGK